MSRWFSVVRVSAAAVVLATAVAACRKAPVTTTGPVQGPITTVKEGMPAVGMVHPLPACGLTPEMRRGFVTAGVLNDTVADWTTWEIPEYQDVQRFTPKPKTTYGPLACIVANPNLTSLTAAQYSSGALVAIIFVDASAAVTVPYTTLKLTKSGFFCVIIKGDVTLPVIDGYITPSVNKSCAAQSNTYRVNAFPRTAPSVSSAASYPAVARWVIQTSWRPGIGVRCMDRWCTLGVPGLSSVDPPAHGLLAPGNPGYAHRLIPGWYDQQQLALRAPTPKPFGLEPVMRASIVPDHRLDGYVLTDFDATNPTPVATVYFTDMTDPTKYYTNWGFYGQGVENTMALRRVGGSTWEVFVNGTLRPNLRVTRTPHPNPPFGHTVGTARWAWTDRDEAVWVRCADGCCLVEDTSIGGGGTGASK